MKILNTNERTDYEWFIKTEARPIYFRKYTFDTIRAMSWISDASFVKDFLDSIDNPTMFKNKENNEKRKLEQQSSEKDTDSLKEMKRDGANGDNIDAVHTQEGN